MISYENFVDSVTSAASKTQKGFEEACQKIRDQGVSPERLMTASAGLTAEGGEFGEVVKKCVFQGKPLNDDTKYHLKRELGDIMWYVAQACLALDTTIEEIVSMNVEKLEARYPGGFDESRSEVRAANDI